MYKMLNYVNDFFCSVPKNKSNLILSLQQRSPVFDKDGKMCDIKTEEISSLILEPDVALGLADSIIQLFNEDDIDGADSIEEESETE